MNKIKGCILKQISRVRICLACILMGMYYFIYVEEGMEFFQEYFAREKQKAISRALKKKIPNIIPKEPTLEDIDKIIKTL